MALAERTIHKFVRGLARLAPQEPLDGSTNGLCGVCWCWRVGVVCGCSGLRRSASTFDIPHPTQDPDKTHRCILSANKWWPRPASGILTRPSRQYKALMDRQDPLAF